jgi:hypothetical protein
MAEASQSDEKLDLKVRDGNGAVTHFKVKKSTKFLPEDLDRLCGQSGHQP